MPKCKFHLSPEEAVLNPIQIMGSENGVYFTFQSDMGAIAEAVPAPLEVAFPLVSGYVVNIDRPAFTQPYREAMLGVYVRYQGQIGLFPVAFLLSGPGIEMATLPGREKFGLPKKMCEREDCIQIVRDGDVVRATAERHGVMLVDVTVKLDGSYNSPMCAAAYGTAAPRAKGGGMSFYMHPLMEPDETNTPVFNKVNMYTNVAEYTYKTWEPGKAAIRLQSSEDDPWGEFPVLAVLGGAYSENDLEMKEVIKIGEADPKTAMLKLMSTRFDKLGLMEGAKKWK